MIADLRGDLRRGAGTVLILIREGIGVEEITVRIEVQAGFHGCAAESYPVDGQYAVGIVAYDFDNNFVANFEFINYTR